METLLQDLRFGLRTMLKNPGFTAVAVVALALGIGANTAIFSVVNAILLRPLAFKEPERLVTVAHAYPKLNLMAPVSPPGFVDYRDRGQVFESATVSSGAGFNLTDQGEAERIQGRQVTASFFPTLGVEALLGRTFLPEEDQPGKNLVAILSHSLWQRRFGGEANVLGQKLTLSDQSYTVVGVMPASFRLFQGDEIFVPLGMTQEQMAQSSRGAEYLSMIARLKPSVGFEQAQGAMNAVAGQIIQENPQRYANDGSWGVKVTLLHEEFVAEIRPALRVLLGAVGFVFLIACANVANLLLARAATRRKEIAVRTALGASRWRVMQQLLTESVLLAFAGGGLGLVLAVWGVELLVKLNEKNIPRALEVDIDRRVLAFTLGLSLLTGILFGLMPALQASKTALTETLKEGGRSSGGTHRARFRNLLVVAEVALALVLLIGAGLMVKSFVRLLDVNPGFQAESLLTMRVSLAGQRYSDAQAVKDFYQQALEKVKALPGVKAAGAVSSLPLSGSISSGFFGIDGRQLAPGEQAPHADFRAISHDYVQTMGIPLIKGRLFNERDAADTPQVVIIDEALARRYWPQEDPLGKRVTFNRDASGQQVWREVVGVIGAIKHKALNADYRGALYFPQNQLVWGGSKYLVVRTAAEPMSLVSAVRAAIRSVDKDQPVYRSITMENLIAESVAQNRFSMLLLGLFAAAALILAAVGLYGVMSYSVTQRTHEIGVRIALGAERRDVMKLVVGQGMVMALGGVVIGLGAAFALAKLISSFSGLLYGVSPTDQTIFIAVPLLLGGVALLASYLPARRAMKVDPMVALRYE
jgi:putative ABC transport system permease protein